MFFPGNLSFLTITRRVTIRLKNMGAQTPSAGRSIRGSVNYYTAELYEIASLRRRRSCEKLGPHMTRSAQTSHSSAASALSCGIMLLAAGQGKRMRSELPKVLHEVGGLPMLFHILLRVREAAPKASVAIIVGHGREQVESAVRGSDLFKGMDIHFVLQPEQKGTGHAARCAMDSDWGESIAKARVPVLVLPGDSPLLTTQLISQMIQPLGRNASMRLLTTELPDPTGYGRIVRRGKSGPVLKIVEQKDASDREKAIREVGASIYFFNSAFLKAGLHRISNKNAQNEYYLTDLISQAARSKGKIEVLPWPEFADLTGANDPWDLAGVDRLVNERHVREICKSGVKMIDPWSIHIDVTVTVGEGSVINPGAILQGRTKIGKGVTIGSNVLLKDMEISDRANIKIGTVGEKSFVGPEAQIGPYAHLRPESHVGSKAKIGNFVELKKSRIGNDTSVAHLSYLGDAEIGERVNIGCGFVTCNFDGRVINGSRKHKTIIEDDVFMGSDCQTVAPVKVGRGSFIASGSTITDDVEPESLAIARSRQVTKVGYAKKLK